MKLTLKSEALAELTADELAGVNAAALDNAKTIPPTMCLTIDRTCILTTV